MKFVTADTRLLSLMLVIGAIGGTFAIVQGLGLGYDYQTPSTVGGAMLAGNVKVTQFGPDGTVIAYRQTDNHIVLQGMEIIMAQVFGNMNSSTTDPGGMYPRFYELTGTHPVRYMQIGTGGEFRLLHNDTNIQNDIAGPGTCGRHLAAITNKTGDGPAHGYRVSTGVACTDAIGDECSAQMNVTATAQFLGGAPDNCAIASIDEAGIFDNSTSLADGDAFDGGLMFARNTFGSVDLGPLDTLQLDWEFTFTDS